MPRAKLVAKKAAVFAATFSTLEEHYAALRSLVGKRPDEVYISTFGVYAGITPTGKDWSTQFENQTHQFLDSLRGVRDVKILVGVPARAPGREAEYYQYLRRLLLTAQHWKKYSWRFSFENHMKCFMFRKGGKSLGCVGGGRNLSDSKSLDMSYRLPPPQIRAVRAQFSAAWKSAKKVTRENLQIF